MVTYLVLVVIVSTFTVAVFSLADAYNGVRWFSGQALPISARLLELALGIFMLAGCLNVIYVWFLKG